MAAMIEEVENAWAEMEGPLVLTTVDSQNIPNSIYATCVGIYEGKPVVADNYFAKTRANIKNGCVASVLFITKDHKAYQLKGKIEYHESGSVYESMKEWNPQKHPGHAAVIMDIAEIYSGAEKLL